MKLVELVGIAPTSSETQTSGSPCSGCILSLIPETPTAGIFKNELSKTSSHSLKADERDYPCYRRF